MKSFASFAVAALLLIPAAAGAQTAEDQIVILMNQLNDHLAGEESEFRIGVIEYMLDDPEDMGQTVFFNNRTKQLGAHWVPGDPRRGGFTDISWQTDQTDGTAAGSTLAATQAALAGAMNTWDNQNCSTIPLTQLGDGGLDLGVIEFIVSGGTMGFPVNLSDLTHGGWGSIDAILGPGTIGVTFTAVFVDGAGNGTDIDNNGKIDVAFREIYYSNQFSWATDGVGNIDVETVVLHEVGHGLSQGHFGKLFQTGNNGKFHFAPKAVMNAGYTGPQQTLLGTDNGGHCSLWGSWPNN